MLTRRRVDPGGYPLVDEKGIEKPIYLPSGKCVSRRKPIINRNEPQCGVLMKLEKIQGLFNPSTEWDQDTDLINDSDDEQTRTVKVDVYPLGFLKTAGNIQATGIPHCFYPVIAKVNRSVRKDPNLPSSHSHSSTSSDQGSSDNDSDDDPMFLSNGPCPPHVGGAPVVRPIASQFYNFLAHHTATQAGAHDSQRGTVTAALAGGFAQGSVDKFAARQLRDYCGNALPADRFRHSISIDDCPTSLRAEFVYSVNVRALKDPSGR